MDAQVALDHFMSVTGVDAATGQKYLREAMQGEMNLTAALETFYSEKDKAAPSAGAAATPRPAAASSSSSSGFGTGSGAGESRFKTLGELNAERAAASKGGGHQGHGHGGSDDDDDDEDDDENRMYAGGEKSGIAIKGPPKEKKDAQSMIKDILKQAAKGGERQHEAEAQRPKTFTGRGNALNAESGSSSAEAEAGSAADVEGEDPSAAPITRHLTFWAEGFSIEDGPLLRYDDPANQAALDQIRAGNAPIQLLNVPPGRPVDVKVAHRIKESYQPSPKKAAAAFSGQGQRLGSIVPAVAPPSSSSSTTQQTGTTQPSTPAHTVDPSKPNTTISVRLGDGTRLVANFNNTDTIGTLRRFVQSARSDGRSFVLQTSMPTKVLEDDSKTLEEAGLLKAVVIQRFV